LIAWDETLFAHYDLIGEDNVSAAEDKKRIGGMGEELMVLQVSEDFRDLQDQIVEKYYH
jgi:hypothetical protein